MSARKYDSSVARIAGNIASGFVGHLELYRSNGEARKLVVERSVEMARAIVAEVERTEPTEKV